MVLLVDVGMLPATTVVGRLIHFRPQRATGIHGFVSAEIHRVGDGLVLVRHGEETPQDSRSVVYINYLPSRPEYSGFWAATRSRVRHRLSPLLGEVGPGEEPAVRALFADYLLTAEGGKLASEAPLIRSGDTVTEEVLVSGYVHDAVSLVVFAGLVYSLVTVRSWPVVVEARKQRRERAMRDGWCPNCGYDTRGLQGRTCPECGKDW